MSKTEISTEPKLKRAVSVAELLKTEFNTFEFDGVWRDIMGCPEKTGVILIWGDSASGKTRFSLKFAKYLTQFARVVYNSIEEGITESMKKAFIAEGMEACRGKIILLNKESMPDLRTRLLKRRSPEIVIIDSWQYMQMSYLDFKAMTDFFKNKLFIVISHAAGKLPKGTADAVRYNAFIKIRVEDYKAYVDSRYGGNGEPYVIWDKGAYLAGGPNKSNKKDDETH